jgi:hypothetical protein
MSRCRSCHEPIVWARTKKGKAIPLDAEDMGGWETALRVPDGNLVLTGERAQSGPGETVPIVRYTAPGEGTHRTHFATCKDADSWRRTPS